MNEVFSAPQTANHPHSQWNEETIRTLNRHMRIQFRYLSSAVRQMTLQQCLEEVHPSEGVDALIAQVEKKLSL